MSPRLDLETDEGAARLRALLAERADAAGGIDVPVSLVIGRARRARQRRRAGWGAAAVASVLIVVAVVLRLAPSSEQSVVVVDGTTTTVVPPTPPGTVLVDGSSSAPGVGFEIAFPRPADQRPGGPPLRLGLDLPGAEVVRATDYAVDPGAFAVEQIMFEIAGPDERRLSVVIASVPEPSSGASAGGEPVALGNGGSAWIQTFQPEPSDRWPPVVTLTGTVEGRPLSIRGTGSSDESIAVASALSFSPDGRSVIVDRLPPGYEVVPPQTVDASPSSIAYRLPDGGSAKIGTMADPTPADVVDLQIANERPTADLAPVDVRSTTGAVRRSVGGDADSYRVIWFEPSGRFVQLTIGQAPGSAPLDLEAFLATIVELDEATFQGLDPAHSIYGP